jgi:hypothetical protein
LTAEDPPPNPTIKLGTCRITAPEEWVRKTPKFRIIADEFSIPKSEGDTEDGRLTVSSASGGVERNIDRWIGQFTQPDGKETADSAKVEESEIAGQKVHLVDISGTYRDQPNPMEDAVMREDYRMLAAIVVVEKANYFVKFYGPKKTVADHEERFMKMIKGLARE